MFDQGKLQALQADRDRWEKSTLEKTLAERRERLDRFMTTSSEPIERLYTPLDVAGLDYSRDLGFPGQYPFTSPSGANAWRRETVRSTTYTRSSGP